MRNAKIVAVLVLTASLVVIVLQNRAPVQTRLLLATVEMPLILLLALTAAIGFGVGLLVAMLFRPKRRLPPDG